MVPDASLEWPWWTSLGALMAALVALMESLVESLVEFLAAQKKTGPRLILPPPGGGAKKTCSHVIYPPKIAERVFDQTIADMQLEWQEAMAHNQKGLARWIQVRGVLTVVLTAAVHAVATLHQHL